MAPTYTSGSSSPTAESHELKALPTPYVNNAGAGFSELDPNSNVETDSTALARLGKKQVLKRRFGLLSMVGFTATVLTTWEALLSLFSTSLINGGPAGSVYGFIIVWIASLSTYSVISEMASMAPTAGGQYYWVSILAPEKYKRLYSYITGWLTIIAWISAVALGGFVNGTQIQGLLVLNYPDYHFERVHGMLLSWAVVAVALFMNTVTSRILPQIEGLALLVHVLGYFGIMIPLVWLAPHRTAHDVFTEFINEGGWPTQGVSFCVGIIGIVAAFAGSDAAVHMSEEIENAALNVPRAIMGTVFLNGFLGLGMILAFIFCATDIEGALATPTGFPFIQIFVEGTKSVGGSTAMAALLIFIGIFATCGFIASASRMTWSFARERALPFSDFIVKLDPHTSIPFIAVGIVSIIPCLLFIINIGSTVVLNDVISLGVSGFYASYLMPSLCLLWRRITGGITTADSDEYLSRSMTETRQSDSVATPPIIWGPWRIPGIWGTINNAFACLYMIFVIFWSFWPATTPTTPETMNYSVLLTGATMMFSGVYYVLWGHKTYKGPLMEL